MNETTWTSITATDLDQRLQNDGIVLLDVRRGEDAVSDPVLIPGAQWRDPNQVTEWGSELPDRSAVAVYCVRGGSVSRGVAEALTAIKGLEVLLLEGGLAAWKEQGRDLAPATVPGAEGS